MTGIGYTQIYPHMNKKSTEKNVLDGGEISITDMLFLVIINAGRINVSSISLIIRYILHLFFVTGENELSQALPEKSPSIAYRTLFGWIYIEREN